MQAENFTNRIFASRLKSAMELRPWKQKDLAEAAGIGQSAVSNYLNGSRMPGSLELFRLAKALNVSMESLVSDREAEEVRKIPEASDPWRDRALQAERRLTEAANELVALAKKISS